MSWSAWRRAPAAAPSAAPAAWPFEGGRWASGSTNPFARAAAGPRPVHRAARGRHAEKRDLARRHDGDRHRSGAAPEPVGAEVEVDLGDVAVKATVARVDADRFALVFDRQPATRIALTRHFYASGYYRAVDEVCHKAVARGLVRRIFA